MFGFFLVMPLVIIIAIGNIAKRCGFYSEGDVAALSKTLYWIILPILLFRTTYISGAEVLNQCDMLIAVNMSYLLTMIISWVAAAFFVHKGDNRRIAVSVFADFRANNVYLGFPVVQLAMGERGLHLASTFIAVIMIFYQVLSIGGGEIALNGRITARSLAGMIKRLVTNPMLVACFTGVVAALAGIPVHFVLDETMKLVSGAATAVALLALGGSLDLPRFDRVFAIIRGAWCDIAIKLVVTPLLTWGALLLFPVDADMVRVAVLLSAMPCAVNCFILAKGMGMDGEYAADLVASTTILGIVAIPAWAYALGAI